MRKLLTLLVLLMSISIYSQTNYEAKFREMGERFTLPDTTSTKDTFTNVENYESKSDYKNWGDNSESNITVIYYNYNPYNYWGYYHYRPWNHYGYYYNPYYSPYYNPYYYGSYYGNYYGYGYYGGYYTHNYNYNYGYRGYRSGTNYSPRSNPRTYDTPRSNPRTYDTPRSNPRTYDTPRSNPRTYDTPRSNPNPRTNNSPRRR